MAAGITTLAARITAGTDPLLRAQDGRSLTRGALAATVLTAAALAALGGMAARVALMIADPLQFIRALAALDGRVAGLLLLSHALPDATAAALVEAGGCTGVLSDRAAMLAPHLAPHGIPVIAAEGALAEAAAAPETQATTWLLTTSGTTGLPKIVPHSLIGLAHRIRPLPPGTRVPVWGHMIDPTRFSGLLLVLQALIGGGQLVLADTATPLARQVAALVEGGVTHLTGAPTLWRRLLMQPGHAALALEQVTLVGEIADAATLGALATAWPGARISHIYGSTEAGQGFSVSDGRAGFPADWLAAAPAGLCLDIRDGILWLQPPPRARDAGPGGGRSGVEMDRAGFIRTGDRVEVRGDRVEFLGRESGLINVAGVKVWPEVVEAVIRAVPGVGLVQVAARRSAVTGALVEARVQPAPGADPGALRGAILDACRTALPREAVPAVLRFVEGLASNAAGKLLRGGGPAVPGGTDG